MGRLTALGVKNSEPGRHGDGDGLYLIVKPSGARSWVLRVQNDGRRRDVGLGSLAALSLAEAREKAAALRKHALNGRDPIFERDKDRRPTPTFKEAAVAAHDALKGGWSEKGAAAFLTSLERHAYQKLGKLRVDQVDSGNIRDMLAPIWLDRPVMAAKVRQRVGVVLNFAKSKGWRLTDAPGRSVTVGLPRQPRTGNFAAMPYARVPALMRDLGKGNPTMSRRALAFLVFTVARSGEVRKARWRDIDFEKRLWHRPAEVMKARAAHTVTLSTPALAILRELKELRLPDKDDVIFDGQGGRPMADMTLLKAWKQIDPSTTVHGIRSAFTDWAHENKENVPIPVIEAVLAHIVADKVQRAYRRTDFLEMRRQLLADWAEYLVGKAAL